MSGVALPNKGADTNTTAPHPSNLCCETSQEGVHLLQGRVTDLLSPYRMHTDLAKFVLNADMESVYPSKWLSRQSLIRI
jgi:hypothetical protein